MRLFRPWLLVGAVVLSGCATQGAVDDLELAGAEPGALWSDAAPVAPWHAAVLDAHEVTIDRDLFASERSPLAAEHTPTTLRLALPGGALLQAELVRITRGARGFVWHGAVAGAPGSEVHVAQVGERFAGTIRAHGRLWSLLPRGDGHVVVEWDEARMPREQEPLFPSGSIRNADGVAVASGDAVEPIDVLVVSTSEAVAGAGGDAGMQALVELAVAEANAGFAASDVPIELTLVATAVTDYDESGFDFADALGRLAIPGDGHMDEVPALRDAVGADHVVLMVDAAGPYAGIGYQMTANNAPYFADAAYSVVSRDYAVGNHTFAHELGHNLGAHHDSSHAGEAYTPTSRGHQDAARGFRTVMAYACAGAWCPRVNRWSDPGETIDGAPAGVHGVSDNAATLRETAAVASAFRPRVTPPPAVARLVEPSDGATLPAGPVTFRWTDVGADAHYLMVGRHPGDDSWFRAHVGTARSRIVDGLPRRGEAVHARIWTLADGAWRFSDHAFVAHRAAFEGAALGVPADGATLASTWTWLGWREVDEARAYWLQVGTASEPRRYFDREVADLPWAFVAGLPADGSEVIAQLWTEGPDGWVAREARYTGWTAPPGTAVIVDPPTGTMLPSSEVTFRVRGGASRSRWLVVRDLRGLLAAEPVTTDAVTVTGLPTDRRELFAIVYTAGADGWVPTTAGYRAALP